MPLSPIVKKVGWSSSHERMAGPDVMPNPMARKRLMLAPSKLSGTTTAGPDVETLFGAGTRRIAARTMVSAQARGRATG